MNKPIKFISSDARDELARRLLRLAEDMVRCRDQGNDHRIRPTDDNIGDIEAAAACVLGCEVKQP
jgi:hypothetical protein